MEDNHLTFEEIERQRARDTQKNTVHEQCRFSILHLEAQVERLRKALEEISTWSDRTNDECLKDHGLAMIQWRGCVSIATQALAQVKKEMK